MAVTIIGSKNGWFPQGGYTRDDELQLREISDGAIAADTEGSDVTSGFTRGKLHSLFIKVSAADYTTGDEEYFIMMEEYLPATSPAASHGAGWYYIQGSMIKLGYTDDSPAVIDTGLYHAVFRVHRDATKIRYAVDVEGTSPSVTLDINLGLTAS
ncbi:hypothetical protein GF357_05080 [Candidatus Dojkabacteria bacterium]|nr:hypothetical protein [Candidatus Dojkabacteria bacterium]